MLSPSVWRLGVRHHDAFAVEEVELLLVAEVDLVRHQRILPCFGQSQADVLVRDDPGAGRRVVEVADTEGATGGRDHGVAADVIRIVAGVDDAGDRPRRPRAGRGRQQFRATPPLTPLATPTHDFCGIGAEVTRRDRSCTAASTAWLTDAGPASTSSTPSLPTDAAMFTPLTESR